MKTTHKTWISPQVFVLGIDGTSSSEQVGSNETYVVGGYLCTDPNDPSSCTPVDGGFQGYNGSV